jgi:hypothetical protein
MRSTDEEMNMEVTRMVLRTDADRQRIIRLCSLIGAIGWIVSEIAYELLLGPHVQLLRSLMIGSGVGALIGFLSSTTQWLVLNRYVRNAGWWIAATTAGYTLGGVLSSFFLYLAIQNTDLFRSTIPLQGILAGAFTGFTLGVVQWLVIGDWVDPDVSWRNWIVPVTVGTALAAPIAWLAGAIAILVLTWNIGQGAWPIVIIGGYLAAAFAGGIVYRRFLAQAFRRTLPLPQPARAAAPAAQTASTLDVEPAGQEPQPVTLNDEDQTDEKTALTSP